jgi:anti-sigma factor ChrR (cupin superfamily)
MDHPHDQPNAEILEQAALYVLGVLGAEEARLFEQHLHECPACEAEVERTREALSGLSLEAAEAVPDPGVRAHLLEQVKAEQEAGSQTQVWKRWSMAPPDGVHVVRGDEQGWQTILDGLEVKQLFADPAAENVTMLVRMAPGSEYPAHRHGGHEQCFVLEGDVEVGEIKLRAGDYQCATTDSVHEVTRTREGCLLMIVSSTKDKLIE